MDGRLYTTLNTRTSLITLFDEMLIHYSIGLSYKFIHIKIARTYQTYYPEAYYSATTNLIIHIIHIYELIAVQVKIVSCGGKIVEEPFAVAKEDADEE